MPGEPKQLKFKKGAWRNPKLKAVATPAIPI
jgi:hypothetical protein